MRQSDEPTIRVLLQGGVGELELRAAEPLRVLDLRGTTLVSVPARTPVWLRTLGEGLRLEGLGDTPPLPAAVTVAGGSNASILQAGQVTVRGMLRVTRGERGLDVVNLVPVERYVVGVVGAELGRRALEETAAVEAQAILARTVAARRLQTRLAAAWDLTAGTADQLYRGVQGETAEAHAAAEATRGVVLLWGGQPIDAFYHSTCGGRTAEPDEVFPSAARPYLQSVTDIRSDGEAWCATSPRFRWRETWTPAQLRTALLAGVPQLAAEAGAGHGAPRVAVRARTVTGRVQSVEVTLGAVTVPVRGPAIRQAFRTTAGQPLWSNAFEVRTGDPAMPDGSVAIEGQGSGHGVGMCQWGAIGRARAGWDRRRILAAYFPGAELARRW